MRGRHDPHTAILKELQQSVVARDEEIGVGGNRRPEDQIILEIRRDDADGGVGRRRILVNSQGTHQAFALRIGNPARDVWAAEDRIQSIHDVLRYNERVSTFCGEVNKIHWQSGSIQRRRHENIDIQHHFH